MITEMPRVVYIESRHQYLPAPYSNDLVKAPYSLQFPASISLASLKNQDWTRTHEVMRPIFYGSFFPHFQDKAMATISINPHPEDYYASEKQFEFLLNAGAIQDIAASLLSLGDKARTLLQRWTLSEIIVSVLPQAPTAQIASVFTAKAMARPETFESDSRDICDLVSELWPFFVCLLTQLDEILRLDKEPYVLCNNRFGLPDDLHALKLPDFDPSEEYQYHPHLFVISDRPDDSWIQVQVQSGHFEKLSYSPREDCTVWTSDATTVWHFKESLEASEMTRLSLANGLHSDIAKLLSFANRLFVALFEISVQTTLDPRQIRQIAFQQHIFYQRMWGRSLLLNEFSRGFFSHSNGRSDISFQLSRMQFLTENSIRLAEGFEADQSFKEDRRLQVIATALGAIAIFALFMDGYIFTFGEVAEEPPGKNARLVIISLVGLGLIAMLVALFRTVLVKTRNSKGADCVRGQSRVSPTH